MDAPAPINSASLHPEKDFFVAGGEDFKLYKFDYSTKEEMGEKQRGSLHFTPVFLSLASKIKFLCVNSELIPLSIKGCAG